MEKKTSQKQIWQKYEMKAKKFFLTSKLLFKIKQRFGFLGENEMWTGIWKRNDELEKLWTEIELLSLK